MLLFGQDAAVLRRMVYEARAQRYRVAKKKDGNTIGLEIAVDNLTRAVEAILNADTVGLRLAGITPSAALEIAKRLQSAAGALTVRR
jgi:hypothetical protein